MTALPASLNLRAHRSQGVRIGTASLIPVLHTLASLAAREVTSLVEAHRVRHEQLAVRRGSLAFHLGQATVRAATWLNGAMVEAMIVAHSQTR